MNAQFNPKSRKELKAQENAIQSLYLEPESPLPEEPLVDVALWGLPEMQSNPQASHLLPRRSQWHAGKGNTICQLHMLIIGKNVQIYLTQKRKIFVLIFYGIFRATKELV